MGLRLRRIDDRRLHGANVLAPHLCWPQRIGHDFAPALKHLNLRIDGGFHRSADRRGENAGPVSQPIRDNAPLPC